MIYFDNNATTPMTRTVKKVIEENLDIPTMTTLFTTITEINYAGIPKPKIDDRKTSGN